MLSKTQILIMLIAFAALYIFISNAAISYYVQDVFQENNVNYFTIQDSNQTSASTKLGLWIAGIVFPSLKDSNVNKIQKTPYITELTPPNVKTIGQVNDMIDNATMFSWISTLILVPIILIITWIIVSSLPTVNGGA